MKVLFLVVVVSAVVVSHAVVTAAFRSTPPNSMDWDEDSGGYPDVDSDFEEDNSDEEDLKLDRHTSAPIIYRAPSRVVYAHHASQADPLEDTSDENYDIGEHAPGPPTYQIPSVYNSNSLENKQDEESIEEYEQTQFISSPDTSDVDISSLEYIPPPVIYSPPLPLPSAYMNPRPIPVVSRGSFSDSPVSRMSKLMNDLPSSPSSPTFVYNNPAPSPVVAYNPPTPAPVVFNGPNSNAAIYSKPPTAQVVYKYALPSPLVNKDEESFPLSEKIIDYDDDNKPEPMVYDSSVYSPSIKSKSTFAPYKYSDLITPSNAFADTFSSQPFYNFQSFNQISPGFAKSIDSRSFLNLYEDPKQYNIDPSPITSIEFRIDPVPKIYENPKPISNVYADSKEQSEIYKKDQSVIYRDLKDSRDFDDIEYEDVDHDILDDIPVAYNEPQSQLSNSDAEDIHDIEYEDVDHDILDAIPVSYNEPKLQISNNNAKDIHDIEYEDIDHDIIDALPITYNVPKSQLSSNNVKNINAKTKPINSNISYQTEFKSKSSEETIIKLSEVKVETTTSMPNIRIPETIVKNSMKNSNINTGTTVEASRITKMPQEIVKPVKSTSSRTNRLSAYSSRNNQQRRPSNYSHRMSVLRASLSGLQRQRYRDRSSEENTRNIHSFRNRLRYRTQGNVEKVMKRRPLSRMYRFQSSENISSEERIYSRRGTMWGRRRQSRQSSEEDDESKRSRSNTRRMSARTTTIKPTTTTEKSKRLPSRRRGRYDNRNRERLPTRQSLQCFLMSIIRDNYRC